MRIIENTPERLVLRGVPGGTSGMAAFLVIGSVLCCAFGAVVVRSVLAGNWLQAAMLSIGVAIGLAMIAGGLDGLCTREDLVLDHAAASGRYTRTHRFARKRRDRREEFAYARVAGVVVERREVTRAAGKGRSQTSIHWKAILRLDHPRHAIVVAESQNDLEIPVRGIAVAVGAALGMPIVEDLAPGAGDEEVVSTAEFTTPLASRAGGPIELPVQPKGSRIAVEIDPDGPVVRFRWRIMGNNALPMIGLVIFGGWTAVSVLFLLAALGVIGGQGRASAGVVAATASFVSFGLVLMAPMVLLVSGAKRTVTVTPESVTARSPVLLGNARVHRSAIKTVRTASGEDDAAIVYHGDGKTRIGLHLPADGEVKWLAGALREAVRAMR